MRFIGIDPGANGGIAWVRGNESEAVAIQHLTERLAWEYIAAMEDGETIARIEKVSAMPGNGVTGMFRFGQSYGFLRGCLVASGIPFDEVTPQRWQKEFGLIVKGKISQTEKKNRNKAKAQQLFPQMASLTITHAKADALLIAEYARRTH